MFKRMSLFLMTNIAVMLTVSIILNLLGVRSYLSDQGINYQSLMVFCLVWGMVGSFISLLLSKKMAKWTMGLKMVAPNSSGLEGRVYRSVEKFSRQAGLPKTPEVALFNSPEINAFATGPSKSNSLVAVSTGLLNAMTPEEVDGVIAHEVSHIANGDMVTMTLLQGVVTAFVMFFAKALSWAAANAMQNDEDGGPPYFVAFAIEIVLTIIFSILANVVVAWFSRKREFRADQGGAKLAGRQHMISALERLNRAPETTGADAGNLAAFKISNKKSMLALLSTHPSLEDRIRNLKR